VYLLRREAARRLAEAAAGEPPGRERHGLLHLRKHADGVRVSAVRRLAGERVVVIDTAGATLVLRLAGAAPALTLAVDGEALASFGEGPPAWPLPAESPGREWDLLPAEDFAAAFESAAAAGRSHARAVLAACPGLGPVLARETDGSAPSFQRLRERLRTPRPALLLPESDGHDADLARSDATLLVPLPLERPGHTRREPASWLEAGAAFLEARRRGAEFERRRKAGIDEARRLVRRLEQLERNLAGDLAGLGDEERLRREAEALLAFGQALPQGAEQAELPDPRDPEARLVVSLDPRRSAAGNADRLYDEARRIERAHRQVELRLRETRAALDEARDREALALSARDAAELAARKPAGEAGERASGPRHYLTSRGLSVLVGRGAKENHHLTFKVARPEDVWLHARDAPGAHVVLRDPEGRAGAEDLREAAELAAFFSESREALLVDVHVTRRKHVRPARGGPGRVFVSHSDTLRVPPRDPEGRLRRR
jgi:hypothetical protein